MGAGSSRPACRGAKAIVARRYGRAVVIGACIPEDDARSAAARLAEIVHLVRGAIDANFLLLSLRLEVAVARAGIGIDSAAIYLLSADGDLIFGNARAEEVLALGDVVNLTRTGRLRFRDREVQARVEGSLHGASPPADATLAAGRTGVRAFVLPADLAVSTEWLRGPLWKALAPHLIVVLSAESDGKVTPDDLARQLGLSRKEAEVALALCEGRTLGEIAEARGLSVHTLRNQVKSALAKTGARRQADLVALVERVRRGG